MEERASERADGETSSDAVAARTRALVEESRRLLARLEALLGQRGRDDEDGDDVTDESDESEPDITPGS